MNFWTGIAVTGELPASKRSNYKEICLPVQYPMDVTVINNATA
jgi:hypothetical protein